MWWYAKRPLAPWGLTKPRDKGWLSNILVPIYLYTCIHVYIVYVYIYMYIHIIYIYPLKKTVHLSRQLAETSKKIPCRKTLNWGYLVGGIEKQHTSQNGNLFPKYGLKTIFETATEKWIRFSWHFTHPVWLGDKITPVQKNVGWWKRRDPDVPPKNYHIIGPHHLEIPTQLD